MKREEKLAEKKFAIVCFRFRVFLLPFFFFSSKSPIVLYRPFCFGGGPFKNTDQHGERIVLTVAIQTAKNDVLLSLKCTWQFFCRRRFFFFFFCFLLFPRVIYWFAIVSQATREEERDCAERIFLSVFLAFLRHVERQLASVRIETKSPSTIGQLTAINPGHHPSLRSINSGRHHPLSVIVFFFFISHSLRFLYVQAHFRYQVGIA